MENYQIGDIVFYSGLLAEVLSVDYANNIPVYSVRSPLLIESEDLLPPSALSPVPLSSSTLSLFFKVNIKVKASYFELNPGTCFSEGISSRTIIPLKDSEFYLTVDTCYHNGKEQVLTVNLWKIDSDDGRINFENDYFFAFYDRFEYIHEIQHVIRALKFNDPFKLKG